MLAVGRTVNEFQSPRGDFGFLKVTPRRPPMQCGRLSWFQSPRGDFGFLKLLVLRQAHWDTLMSFNPLAGILVF